jgi:hypothetical protein
MKANCFSALQNNTAQLVLAEHWQLGTIPTLEA